MQSISFCSFKLLKNQFHVWESQCLFNFLISTSKFGETRFSTSKRERNGYRIGEFSESNGQWSYLTQTCFGIQGEPRGELHLQRTFFTTKLSIIERNARELNGECRRGFPLRKCPVSSWQVRRISLDHRVSIDVEELHSGRGRGWRKFALTVAKKFLSRSYTAGFETVPVNSVRPVEKSKFLVFSERFFERFCQFIERNV